MCAQGNEGCNNSNYNEIKINCGPVLDYIKYQGRAEDFFLPLRTKRAKIFLSPHLF